MYFAKELFTSSKGILFFKGEQISDFRYFFLSSEDKKKFSKNKVNTEPRAIRSTLRSSPSHHPTHYGYGPEPGYTSEAVPTSHYVPSADHPSHDFGGYGEGSGGGAGASGSWDPGSSDSGGGDSGGGGGD